CFICSICTNAPRRHKTYSLFFVYDPAPSRFYTLSLHDALPICPDLAGDWRLQSRLRRVSPWPRVLGRLRVETSIMTATATVLATDRKSTRLNSSHVAISYAVFCLKKKKTPCASCATASSSIHIR